MIQEQRHVFRQNVKAKRAPEQNFAGPAEKLGTAFLRKCIGWA